MVRAGTPTRGQRVCTTDAARVAMTTSTPRLSHGKDRPRPRPRITRPRVTRRRVTVVVRRTGRAQVASGDALRWRGIS